MSTEINSDDASSVEDDWAAAMQEQVIAETAAAQGGGDSYSPAELERLSDEAPGTAVEANLETVLEIPVTVSMEIGRTEISIRNLLQLTQGSVVELDRLAGEPLDVMANGTLVAHGEVVVVNERFGIRLTDVVSAQERVKKLK